MGRVPAVTNAPPGTWWAQRLAALEARVAQLEADRRPPRGDQILIAIARVVNGPFTARELVAASATDEALASALGTTAPRKVGKILRALIGRAVGPYGLERVKRENGGRLWRVSVRLD